MKRIPLTQGQFAIVDDADYEWLNQWKWYAIKDVNTFYAGRRTKKAKGKPTSTQMHVEIIGRKDSLQTDHINGDGLDNQRHNLRHVTSRQNHQNLHIKKSSKYPGVCWHKRERKWRSYIKIKGKLKHLGSFTNEEEAAQAYQEAAAAL